MANGFQRGHGYPTGFRRDFPTAFRRLGRRGVSRQMISGDPTRKLSDGFPTGCPGVLWQMVSRDSAGIRRVSDAAFRRVSDGWGVARSRGKWFLEIRRLSDGFPTAFRWPFVSFPTAGTSRGLAANWFQRIRPGDHVVIFLKKLTAIRRVSDGRVAPGRCFLFEPRPQEKCFRRLSDGYLTAFGRHFFSAPFSS